MREDIDKLVKAISARQSNRHYLPELLESNHRDEMNRFIKSLDPPFDTDVELNYHEVPNDDKIVYFKGPPQFISLSTSESILDKAKAGFLGELVILYAESLGVKTCWMGHFKKKEVYQIVHNSSEEESSKKIFCIITLGYIPDKTGLLDRFSKWRMSKKNRSVSSFLHEDSMEEFPENIRFALDLAGKAPSAMNSQKWYYHISTQDEKYTIEISKPNNYQHFKWKHYNMDVGAAAAHCWLGLSVRGLEPIVSLSTRENDVIWKFMCK
ncbi:MAG: hypothetical protein GF411_03695 [Candidatus Lokiarchaeota archaeon]|nr:hypothetical protein [Candidatus Lokiarchaeota archaeon]